MAHASTAADLSVSSLFNFKDHVVLVTGGATGLGEMAAQSFVQNGARVIIASRKQGELEKTSQRLNQLGPGRCEYVVADLKDKKGCEDLCKKVKEKVSRLTVLLNNSGATWYACLISCCQLDELLLHMRSLRLTSNTRSASGSMTLMIA